MASPLGFWPYDLDIAQLADASTRIGVAYDTIISTGSIGVVASPPVTTIVKFEYILVALDDLTGSEIAVELRFVNGEVSVIDIFATSPGRPVRATSPNYQATLKRVSPDTARLTYASGAHRDYARA